MYCNYALHMIYYSQEVRGKTNEPEPQNFLSIM